jgi:hypothetical protein
VSIVISETMGNVNPRCSYGRENELDSPGDGVQYPPGNQEKRALSWGRVSLLQFVDQRCFLIDFQCPIVGKPGCQVVVVVVLLLFVVIVVGEIAVQLLLAIRTRFGQVLSHVVVGLGEIALRMGAIAKRRARGLPDHP